MSSTIMQIDCSSQILYDGLVADVTAGAIDGVTVAGVINSDKLLRVFLRVDDASFSIMYQKMNGGGYIVTGWAGEIKDDADLVAREGLSGVAAYSRGYDVADAKAKVAMAGVQADADLRLVTVLTLFGAGISAGFLYLQLADLLV